MIREKILLPGLILMILLSAQLVAGQQLSRPKPGPPGSWRVIGTTHAGFKADHDAIVVTGPADNFRKIKFKVTDAPLNLLRLVVTYDNGVPDKIEVRFNIPQGGESRVIDLNGGSRSLKRIDFWYDTKGVLKGTADVTVVGMK
jgi:hypothetical protein